MEIKKLLDFLFQMSVVVAGGTDSKGLIETEILDPGAEEWRYGADLPVGKSLNKPCNILKHFT